LAPLRSRNRKRRALAPRLESLEHRALLAVNIVEYPLPSGDWPQQLVAGIDNTLWFTDPATNAIGRVNAATGAVTEFSVPTAQSSLHGITAAPDGTVWFTETVAGRIGKLNPSTGEITEYPLSTPGAEPLQITFGPDGNVWFTEFSAPVIGKLAPATGAITQVPAPRLSGSPFDIVAGPGGKLWFDESGGAEIGSIDPATGAFALHSTGSAEPTAISGGSDGNLWFAVANQNIALVALNPQTGAQSAYAYAKPAPGPSSEATSIVSGSDGNLWITDPHDHQIWSIDPSTGASQTYTVPTASSSPTAIADGPAGTLWFLEPGAHQLGELRLNAPAIATTTSVTSETNPSAGVARFTATVTASNGGPPAGTVTFVVDGESELATSITAANGRLEATYSAGNLKPGSHTIQAWFHPGSGFGASQSGTLIEQIHMNSGSGPEVGTTTPPSAQAPGTVTPGANASPCPVTVDLSGKLWPRTRSSIARLALAAIERAVLAANRKPRHSALARHGKSLGGVFGPLGVSCTIHVTLQSLAMSPPHHDHGQPRSPHRLVREGPQ
jgi:virginiamycin B lyase